MQRLSDQKWRLVIVSVCVTLLASRGVRQALASLILVVIVSVCSLSLAVYLAARRTPVRASPPRPLAFAATQAAWAATQHRYDAKKSIGRALHPSLSPSVNESIDALLQLILRHFVHDWLDRLTGPNAPAFSDAVDSLVRHSLAAVIERAERVDWTLFAVSKLVPRLTTHLERFKAAQASVRSSGSADAFDDVLLARAFARDGRGGLHKAVDVAGVDSRPAEEAHLAAIVGKVLPLVLPPSEAASGAVTTMAREIVACAILANVVQLLSGA